MAAMHGEGMRKAFPDVEFPVGPGSERAGMLVENAYTTPVILVAADAKSASGLWMVLAASTAYNPESGAPECGWAAVHAAVDLIEEDGAWRIKRFRIAPRFRCPYDRSWAEVAKDGPVAPPPGLVPAPDLPPTGPATDYGFERVPMYDPVPAYDPEPRPGEPVDETDRRIRRLEDVFDIQNLMGMHEYLHAAGRNGEEFERLFARRTEGLAFEPEDWGQWLGAASIHRAYVLESPPNDPGIMTEHAITTGVVEVAGDGRTAKGVWISPGHETFPLPPEEAAEHGPGARAHWSWGRYGVDFVKEDGVWKFWHFHIYTSFRTPFERDWVDAAINRPPYFPPIGEVMPGMHGPDRPVSFNQPYDPAKTPVQQPVPPAPYQTWAKTWSYTG
jgi:hypothetical protein